MHIARDGQGHWVVCAGAAGAASRSCAELLDPRCTVGDPPGRLQPRIGPRLVTRAGWHGCGLIAGFVRLGDRHRLVLNSSGFIPLSLPCPAFKKNR